MIKSHDFKFRGNLKKVKKNIIKQLDMFLYFILLTQGLLYKINSLVCIYVNFIEKWKQTKCIRMFLDCHWIVHLLQAWIRTIKRAWILAFLNCSNAFKMDPFLTVRTLLFSHISGTMQIAGAGILFSIWKQKLDLIVYCG